MIPSALLLGLIPAWIAPQDPAPARETVRETYPDGARRSEGEAVRAADGSLVLDGKFASYHPDGSRESVGRYRAGRRHGSWRFLYPGGDPKRAEGSYKDGWRDGPWKAWTPDGKFDESQAGTYRTLRSQHPGGATLAEGETLDGVPHGRWELYWDSGAPMASGELRHGRLQGPWLFRHEDGSLDPAWIGGVYEHGVRVRDLAPEERPEGPEPDPGRLPALGPSGELPVGMAQAAREALERLRAEPASDGETQREADLALLLRLGSALDPLALAELSSFDLADPLGARQARRFEISVLRARTGGVGFGLREGVSPADQDWNRRCVLRWRSLLQLARLDPYLLEFELAHPYLRPGEAAPEDAQRLLDFEYLSHRSPSLPIPGLDGDAARAEMHPFVAPRLAGRRAPEAAWGKAGVQALDAALAWLRDHQASDGRWSGASFHEHNALGRTCVCDGPGMDVHDVGLTGLALLALMGDGSSPRHGRHAVSVRRGLTWLRKRQQPESGLVVGGHSHGFIYDHAIATQALCEAAALCDDAGLRLAAQAAVDLCLRARNPRTAWRYELAPDGSNDTSITGWMVTALRAGQDAGLAVDAEAFAGALEWIERVTDPTTGRCGYDVAGSLSARVPGVNDRFPPDHTEALSAAALLCRYLIGSASDAEAALAGYAELLRKALPAWEPGVRADFYYWYYGSQAMARRGGADWSVWSKALRSAVIERQREDGDFAGSWDPIDPWSYAGGRIYATALLALCLEAPFRQGAAPEAR